MGPQMKKEKKVTERKEDKKKESLLLPERLAHLPVARFCGMHMRWMFVPHHEIDLLDLRPNIKHDPLAFVRHSQASLVALGQTC